jgi:sporulation protein YabP
MVEEKRVLERKHRLSLDERERLVVDGVVNVESFDDREIVLETELGVLVVRGEDLHIKELNLESANLAVEGYVKCIEYASDSLGKRSKGLLARLLK